MSISESKFGTCPGGTDNECLGDYWRPHDSLMGRSERVVTDNPPGWFIRFAVRLGSRVGDGQPFGRYLVNFALDTSFTLAIHNVGRRGERREVYATICGHQEGPASCLGPLRESS